MKNKNKNKNKKQEVSKYVMNNLIKIKSKN